MRFPFWATVFMLLGVAVLCGLGVWQLERLEWKRTLLRAVEAEYEVDASQVQLSPADFEIMGSGFKRGFLTGVYRHEHEVFIQARTHEGVPGYHLLTPFQVGGFDGSVVLVNRGWVPIEREMPQDGVVVRPPGAVTVVGMVRRPPEDNMFVPENRPDQGQWYRIDLRQIAKAMGEGGFLSHMLYVETEDGVAYEGASSYPVSAAGAVHLNNNHAQYAFFWFTMAAILVFMYVLRFLAPQRDRLV